MKKTPSILFFIPSLSGGGAERVMLLIVCFFAEKYDLKLVVCHKEENQWPSLPDSVRVWDLKKTNRFSFFSQVLGLHRIIIDESPDIVISFSHYANIVAALALLGRRKKPKFIVNERSYPRGYLTRSRWGFVRGKLIGWAYRQADMVIANAEKTKKTIELDFHVAPQRLKTIYNPIDLREVLAQVAVPAIHPFFKGEGQTILGVGRLIEIKRFDVLIRGFARVKERFPNGRLIIIGEGPEREKLEILAKSLGVSSWVDLVGYQANPYAWMCKADLFVLTSQYEGCPNVLLEAMACGIGVISVDCPAGPREIITHGQDGFLVPQDDFDGLVKAILTLLENEELRRSLSQRAKKKMRNFCIKKIALQFEDLWN